MKDDFARWIGRKSGKVQSYMHLRVSGNWSGSLPQAGHSARRGVRETVGNGTVRVLAARKLADGPDCGHQRRTIIHGPGISDDV